MVGPFPELLRDYPLLSLSGLVLSPIFFSFSQVFSNRRYTYGKDFYSVELSNHKATQGNGKDIKRFRKKNEMKSRFRGVKLTS